MSKFKVGDKVRVVSTHDDANTGDIDWLIGQVEIVCIADISPASPVDWDCYADFKNATQIGLYENELELVKE